MYFLTYAYQCAMSCVATFWQKNICRALMQWPTYLVTNSLQELLGRPCGSHFC